MHGVILCLASSYGEHEVVNGFTLLWITIIIIIMFSFKYYFSREHIALSLKNCVNIKLTGPTDCNHCA